MSTTPMTRDDVERIVREARERGARPDLSETDLRGVDLFRVDLRGADLRGADLSGTILREADLFRANLSGANLSGTILTGAILRGADLRGADLSGTILRRADLFRADLRGTGLSGTILSGADLRWTRGVVPLGVTPSGESHMVPLPTGEWQVTVGCWDGTTTDLRALIAGDDWPEATGDERDHRRPILTTLADHADALATYHADWLAAVVDRWGSANKETTR